MELVALHADQPEDGVGLLVGPQQAQVVEVGLDVLVDGLDPHGRPATDAGVRLARWVQRAVRHEAAPEALDATVARILARLHQDDAQRPRGHGAHAPA
jgi:hypothetical protein